MSSITKVRITGLHVGRGVTFNCADLAIQQDFNPTWKAEQAYGKMDPIMAYSHTGRKASFEMVLLATTLNAAMSLQSKVDTLIKLQYPRTTGNRLAAPPFFKVTALSGKLYNSIKGAMDSIKITPGSTEDVVPLVSPGGYFFERKYKITFTMTVLHDGGNVTWNGSAEPGGRGGQFVFSRQRGTGTAETRPAPTSTVTENVGSGELQPDGDPRDQADQPDGDPRN